MMIDFSFRFYFTNRKSKCNADDELNRVFKILSSQENDVVRPRTITHLGRDLKFDKTCGQVLFSTFDDLCDRVRINLYHLLSFWHLNAGRFSIFKKLHNGVISSIQKSNTFSIRHYIHEFTIYFHFFALFYSADTLFYICTW